MHIEKITLEGESKSKADKEISGKLISNIQFIEVATVIP